MPTPDWKNVKWYKPPEEDPPGLLTRVSSYVAMVIVGGLLGAVGLHVAYWYFLSPGKHATNAEDQAFYEAFGRGFLARTLSGGVLGAAGAIAFFLKEMWRESQRDERSRQSEEILRLREETQRRRAEQEGRDGPA